jgi:hypothetical protein
LEHPGVKVFNTNKRVLKAKATAELHDRFTNITDRKYVINEAIISLKHKLISELSMIRMKNRYQLAR